MTKAERRKYDTIFNALWTIYMSARDGSVYDARQGRVVPFTVGLAGMIAEKAFDTIAPYRGRK